jgi:hypothetical protein
MNRQVNPRFWNWGIRKPRRAQMRIVKNTPPTNTDTRGGRCAPKMNKRRPTVDQRISTCPTRDDRLSPQTTSVITHKGESAPSRFHDDLSGSAESLDYARCSLFRKCGFQCHTAGEVREPLNRVSHSARRGGLATHPCQARSYPLWVVSQSLGRLPVFFSSPSGRSVPHGSACAVGVQGPPPTNRED